MPRTVLSSQRLRVLLMSVVTLLVTAVPSAVAGDTTRSVRAGWWWAAQASARVPVPVPYGSEPGQLFVSRQAGAHEKAAAAWIDVSDLAGPPESLVVTFDELQTAPVSTGALLACPVANKAWAPAQGGQWSTRATGDCLRPDAVVGSRSSTGVWSFDLTAMAGSWVTGRLPNFGFELVPARSLRYPSFEIGLRTPTADDLQLIVGGAAAPPAVAGPVEQTASADAPVDSPLSPTAPAATSGGPTLRWSLPRRAQPAAPDPETSTAPTPPAPAAAEERIAIRDAAARLDSESNDAALPLIIALFLAGAGVGVRASRSRSGARAAS